MALGDCVSGVLSVITLLPLAKDGAVDGRGGMYAIRLARTLGSARAVYRRLYGTIDTERQP